MNEVIINVKNEEKVNIDFLQPENIKTVVATGLKGEPGNFNTAIFNYVQSSPASSWLINHNLGYQPTIVKVKSVGGVEVEAEVIHINNNQVQINFNTNFAGSAQMI